jgi:hypothetical protein
MQLVDLLARLYETEQKSRLIVAEAGLDTIKIKFNGSSAEIWSSIISEAEKHDKVFKLVEIAFQQHKPRNLDLFNALEHYIRILISHPQDGQKALGSRCHQWEQHVDKLLKLSLPLSHDEIERAYAITPRATTPLPLIKDETKRFVWIVEQLEQDNFIDGTTPPLLEFVDVLARYIENNHLDHWIQQGCDICKLARGDLAGRQNGAEEAVIIIAIHRERDKYRLQGWVHLPNNQYIRISHGNATYTQGQLTEPVNMLFREGLRKVPVVDRVGVEFFLPRQLLAEPFHTWKLIDLPPPPDEEAIDSPILLELCRKHSVVVRSTERALLRETHDTKKADEQRVRRERWRDKWRRLKEMTVEDGSIFKLEPTEDFNEEWWDNLYAALHDPVTLCLAETRPLLEKANLTTRVCWHLIDAGLPAGVWLATKAEHSGDVYDQVETLIVGRLSELPKRVITHRKSKGKHILREMLILFWDSYDRQPRDLEDDQLELVP